MKVERRAARRKLSSTAVLAAGLTALGMCASSFAQAPQGQEQDPRQRQREQRQQQQQQRQQERQQLRQDRQQQQQQRQQTRQDRQQERQQQQQQRQQERQQTRQDRQQERQQRQQQPPQQRTVAPQQAPSAPPAAANQDRQLRGRAPAPTVNGQRTAPQQAPSTTTAPTTTAPTARTAPLAPAPSGATTQTAPTAGSRMAAPSGAPAPRRIEDVRQHRVETVTKSGARLIQEPGNRTIVRQNNTAIITRNEAATFNSFTPRARSTAGRNGGSVTVYSRPGGVNVYSEFDRNGRLLRRYRRDPSGREFVYVDNRRFYRNLAIGVGVGALALAAVVNLPPPAYAMPRSRYIVDYVDASDDDLYETMIAPPIERLDRTYSLEQIRYSHSLRERMRRIDLDNINFDTGSFEVTPDQYDKLARIAHVLRRIIDRNPTEVFLIEGHTDAVGSDEDNLSLSDHRAETVARILVEHFQIPIENLTTQGYGEQYLKIETQGPERANRRVALRRITPLLSRDSGGPDGPPPPRR